MKIISKPGSVVSRIEIETSPHKQNAFGVYFTEHAAPDLLENIQKQLNEIGGGDIWMSPLYCVIKGNKLREVIDCLFRNQQISAEERADIEGDIRKTESNLGYAEKTITDATTAQQDMIEEFISPYLENIVSLSTDHRKVLTLLEYPFSRHFASDFMDMRILIKSCGKNAEECKDVIECLEALRKVCWGEANLEETYKQLGAQVPSLIKQREMVVNSCLKFINAQFKLLSIDDRFHCAAELIMMSDRTQSNIFPSHTKWFLDRILEGKEEQRTIYLAFVHLGGIGTVLSRAATKANLTEEEKQALIEIKRSQILLENIGSDFSSSSVTARHSLFSSSDSDSAAGTAPKQFDGETFLAHFAVDLVLAKSVEIQEKDGVCSFVFPETTDLKDLEALSERLFERGGFDSRLHEANKGGRKIGPRLEIIENRKELEAWMDEQKVRSNPH